jgi:aryl-phospho-beta-D-glucosidase BglC (GH1 family)
MDRLPATLLLASIVIAGAIPAVAQLTPNQAIVQMGRGINLGNTLEPPIEGGWNNGPAQEHYFDDYRAAGFSTVRIPVRWDQHTQGSPPYAIDPAWLDRVEQIVDWGLERDLIIIINGHHEDWLEQNYTNAAVRARYDSIWSQVATQFRDKSDRLLFEIINEPFGMTTAQVDDLNARILGIIRKTNPTRIVIYSGNEWSGAAQMMAAKIPDDDYIMSYFHSYDPWSFAGEAQGTWGSDADRAAIHDQFRSVANWSAANGVPVMISEFGAVRSADYNSRMAHYATYVEAAVHNNIATQVWDDGGDFGLYQRDSSDWDEIKDILINAFPDGPTSLSLSVDSDSVVMLRWTNRSSAFSAIRVERRLGDGPFTEVAQLAGNAREYVDTAVSGGITYYYRVIAESGLIEDRYSYPIRIHVRPWVRSCFGGAPFAIPGTIEAEDYDIGGDGLTYHDTDEANIPGAYRPTEAVDIEVRSDGGFQVAYIASGEWLEYTVDVEEAGEYLATAYIASVDGGGRFRFEFGGAFSRTLTVPSTGNWQTLTAVSRTMLLDVGEQIMRIAVFAAMPFNIDRFVIEKATATSVQYIGDVPQIEAYPNPTRQDLTVAYASTHHGRVRVDLFDVLGRRVHEILMSSATVRMNLDGLPAGVYFVRVYEDDQLIGGRSVVRM